MVSSIQKALVANVTFPLSSYLMNRKDILSRYRSLVRTQWEKEAVMQKLQLEKLQRVVHYAYHHTSFYRKRFDDIGLLPEDVRSLSDLKRIPPLTRQDVIECSREMVDKRLVDSIAMADQSKRGPGIPIPLAAFRKHQLVKNTSSGSTGAPTAFYEDGSQTAMNWTHELRFRNWFGIEPGAAEARMARISNEFVKNNFSSKLRKFLWNQLPLPGVNLEAEDYSYVVKQLKQFKPEVIWGFTSAIVGLAEYLKKNGLSAESFAPKLIITWAAPFYPHEQALLEQVFECATTNIYGLREVGHVGARCAHGNLHINHENLLMETDPVEGGSGELLATHLDIHAMPFIRYRTGDLGEVGRSDCPCRMTLPLVKNFVGRTGEVFYTKEGRMISPNFWCRFFMNGDLGGKVHRFQVKYLKSKDIDLTVVKGDGFEPNTENLIREKFYESFTPDTMLNIKYTLKILPTLSGKYQMVVKE